MGSDLMKSALMPMQELGLSPGARLVLVRMCLTAKDADRPPVYYAGWQALSIALGYLDYTPAAKQAVKRAVRELVHVGLIKPLGAPGPGHNVTYAIRL